MNHFVGFLICLPFSQCSPQCKSTKDLEEILSHLNANRIEKMHQILTKRPHVAGSKQDRKLDELIYKSWKMFGLDEVSRSTYDFLFSLPNIKQPNKVHVLDDKGNQVWSSKHKEDSLLPSDEDPNFLHGYHAFSPKGDVQGELVFVHRGTEDDHRQLKQLGISLEGKICFARSGGIYRGDIVRLCENAGAIGVITFQAPIKYNISVDEMYPNSFRLHPSGIERGSVIREFGDPLSPDWPSIPNAYRLNVKESKALPKIPSQPIGYGDALELISRMGGLSAPPEWATDFPVEFKIGPGFSENDQAWKVQLVVNNYLEDKNSNNIVGIIRGHEEPDRYIAYGNHRDAWGYGAIDPSSGTAALMEVAFVLGYMRKKGWRPRRSIVLISFTTEEFYLGGSTEFVYENIHLIKNRFLAYVNNDLCTFGSIVSPMASSQLKDVVNEALKSVLQPGTENQTTLEHLMEYKSTLGQKGELIAPPASGYDHAPFIFYAGVPIFNVEFATDRTKYPEVDLYPAYHTGFDTLHLFKKFYDPDYKYTRACAQISAHVVLNLALSDIIPYNLDHLVKMIRASLQMIENEDSIKKLTEADAMELFSQLKTQIDLFSLEAESFMQLVRNTKNSDPIRQRGLNDKLMLVERIFIIEKGLPGRPTIRHSISSPPTSNAYGSSQFPGLVDLLQSLDEVEVKDKVQQHDLLKRHISDLMIIFKQATSFIKQE